jgi:hypothetical protein
MPPLVDENGRHCDFYVRQAQLLWKHLDMSAAGAGAGAAGGIFTFDSIIKNCQMAQTPIGCSALLVDEAQDLTPCQVSERGEQRARRASAKKAWPSAAKADSRAGVFFCGGSGLASGRVLLRRKRARKWARPSAAEAGSQMGASFCGESTYR